MKWIEIAVDLAVITADIVIIAMILRRWKK